MQNCVMSGLGVKVQVYFIFHFSKLTSYAHCLKSHPLCVYVACFMKKKKKKKKIFKMWNTYCTVDQCQFV